MSYLLTESLIDTVSVYLIVKKLITPFNEWDACKLGIINKDGKKLKDPKTSKERDCWDLLTRFCWNFKKIISKFIGKGNWASYLSVAALLKDSFNPYYIEINQQKLNETLLKDMTYSKQLQLHNLIQSLPVIEEKVTEENIVLLMFKYLDQMNEIIKEHNIEWIE